MDNDDLFAAMVVFTLAVLLYLLAPSLAGGVWIP